MDCSRESCGYNAAHIPEVCDSIQLLLDHGAIDTPPTPERDRTSLEVVSENFRTEEDGAEDNTVTWIPENLEENIGEYKDVPVRVTRKETFL